MPAPTPIPERRPSLSKDEPAARPEKPDPRAVASFRLTDRAHGYLDMGQPDDAIRTLERAINLYPDHGENYYYLAEAWIMKGNRAQAGEFNRLAALYLKDSPAWRSRLARQVRRIEGLTD
ncbi:MAG: tetratricopeptide repeat protein [Desulfatiglandales bacterium]